MVVADFLIVMEEQVVQVLVVHVTEVMDNKMVAQALNLVNQENQVTTDLVTRVVTVRMTATPTTEHKVAQVVVQVVQVLNQVKEQMLLLAV